MLKFRTMVKDADSQLADVVPLDALDEPMFKLRERPARDPRRPGPAALEPGRAAAAGERAAEAR